ncbi:S41 family peptidase [Streptomyces anulatus]|uniref:S41 family peptidase n=1 Tax=Streptomyces anulatus TaxID=1892 RepID=UPI00386B2BF1
MSNVLRMNSVRRKRRNLASTTVPDAIDFSEGPGPARAVVYPERELPPGGVPAYLAARKSGARSFVLWADEDRRERVATVVTESAVDWHAQRDRYRPTVDAGTTPDELFAVFSEMVEPLHDAHVAVQDGDRVFARPRPGTVVPNGKLDARIKKFIVERDLGNARNLQDFAGGRITCADLPGGQGYLRISGFGGYAGDDTSHAAQLAELDRALDTALGGERSRRPKSLIIDLRINGGGFDALGIHIAERLTDSPYVAYSKRARNDPADPSGHTRPRPVHVTPAQGPRHTGPVAVLTGGSTFSAGETFVQALMDRPGRTVRIGQPTQGVFSDVMTRKLPGDMSAWLPNEEFLTRSGRTFDGTGIPPHLTEPVFTKEEFDEKRDSAFDRAVNVLRHHGGATG